MCVAGGIVSYIQILGRRLKNNIREVQAPSYECVMDLRGRNDGALF